MITPPDIQAHQINFKHRLFALPAGIIASGFAAELQSKGKHGITCPHCGKEIEG